MKRYYQMSDNERRNVKKAQERWILFPPRWAYPDTIGKEEYSIKALLLSICIPIVCALLLLGVASMVAESMTKANAVLIKHALPLTYLAMLIPSLVYMKYVQMVTGEKCTTPKTIAICSVYAGILSAPIFSVAALVAIFA